MWHHPTIWLALTIFPPWSKQAVFTILPLNEGAFYCKYWLGKWSLDLTLSRLGPTNQFECIQKKHTKFPGKWRPSKLPLGSMILLTNHHSGDIATNLRKEFPLYRIISHYITILVLALPGSSDRCLLPPTATRWMRAMQNLHRSNLEGPGHGAAGSPSNQVFYVYKSNYCINKWIYIYYNIYIYYIIYIYYNIYIYNSII